MSRKKVALTFDYEVFLGLDSGCIHASLLEPVDRILALFEKTGSKGIFFVDATFLLELQQRQTEAYKLVESQLKRILSSGSFVELHLHPHWQDARLVESCRWRLDNNRYFRLHSLEPQRVLTLFREATELLNQIVAPFSQERVTAFRAGGWCIQPFADLRPAFIESGLEMDFSVMPGKSRNNIPVHYYDFKDVPRLPWWRFEHDVCQSEPQGSFIQIPLTMLKLSRIDMLKNRRNIRGQKYAGDGKGAAVASSLWQKLNKVLSNESMPLSIDFISLPVIKPYLHRLDEFSVLVGHPKILTEDGFRMLEYCCQHFDTVNTAEIKSLTQGGD